jgi:hypothetical protein
MFTGSFKKLFVLLGIFPLASFAKLNDWSKPCLRGECTYDIPKEQGSGSIRIVRIFSVLACPLVGGLTSLCEYFQWGSADTISDITEAAGWAIIGCDANAIKQNIRLVCLDAAVCGHLYQTRGPVNKIVRLPENVRSHYFIYRIRYNLHGHLVRKECFRAYRQGVGV